MPKIALDISPTFDGNSLRGMGYYVKQLATALQDQLKSNPDFKSWKIDLITDNRQLRSQKYDLIHYPYFDPYKLTLPPKNSTPVIVTVPDLTPRQFKKHYPVGLKGEIKWFLQKHRLRRVNSIITISHYSRRIINQIIGYPQDRIFVTWLAADPSFQPQKQNLENIRKKYRLPPKFVLYLGDIDWNKNIPKLVRACLSLKYPLVIVGSAATKTVPNHPWTKDIHWLQKQNSPYLHLTGYIPDEDLPFFFNLATLCCQPSYAEGFGLAPVKALQSGCPVVYANATSLPEIVDTCSQPFNPHSLTDLKKSLKLLWTSPKLRQKYIDLGLKRAKFFNWSDTALQTLAVYQLTLLHEKH